MSDTAAPSSPENYKAYLIVGIVAATVSAATAAYIFWSRSRHLGPNAAESVQELLDRCHDQVRSIEQKLGDLHRSPSPSSSPTAA